MLSFEKFRHLNLVRPMAVLDLETTGTSVERDRIIEWAVLRITPEDGAWAYSMRLNPEIPIPASATAVHGIKDEDVAKCPTFAEIADSLEKLLAGCDLCGYNIKRFDLPLLAEEFFRCGINFPFLDRTIIDVYQIYCEQEPRNLTGAVGFYCGEQFDEAHAAHADVDATALVLDAQLGRYGDLPRTVDDLHRQFKGPDYLGKLAMKDGKIVFNFGKHRGRPLVSVAREDPQYLQWIMASGDFYDDVKDHVGEALHKVHRR